jgi:diadenosine tetraphosphatase ApaH/serine/threonine PP2A family protein phosphatase
LETLKLPTVRGNHDRWIAELPVEKMSPALVYTRAQLSETQRAALGKLPVTHRPAEGVLMCHGTPTDDYTYLLEEGHEGTLLLSRPDAVAKRLQGFDAELILCGHSHTPAMALAPGNRLVVNPGSVGCPIFADNPSANRNNARAPHARYAIVTKQAGVTKPAGRWNAEFISLAYDWDAAAARARVNGREEWARSYVFAAV